MTQPQISNIEGGDSVPTPPLLARLADALDAALTIRLDGNDPAFAFTPHHGPRPGEPTTGGTPQQRKSVPPSRSRLRNRRSRCT